MSILDLLYKGGKAVLSPATQARNLIGARNYRPWTGAIYAESKAQTLVQRLIDTGQLSVGQRDIYTRRLAAEIAENLKKASTSHISNQDLVKILAGLGFGAASIGIGAHAEDEAVEEMEEVTQTEPTFREKFESGQWGEPVANILMDIISPIPRQK
jgi:hypothetical protein